jgi:hypothetical protein
MLHVVMIGDGGTRVKIRRTKRSIDLRNLPLDGFDMFLLTQLESTLSLPELLDIAPCDHDETIRRLHQLVGFQLVEVSGKPGERLPPAKPQKVAKKSLEIEIPAGRPDFEDEDTGTLRPPPKKRGGNPGFSRTLSEDDAATLRPPAPLAVKDMMREAEETTVQRVVDRSSGVVEKRPENVEFETPQKAVGTDGRAVRDRSVFARTTLVDDDAEERARSIR